MSDSARPTADVRARRWHLVWLLLGIGAMGAAASCARQQQPTGSCIRASDTAMVRDSVTEDQCTEICPSGCYWEQGGN